MDSTEKRRLTLNRIVSILIFSDLALLAGWGLITPIMSVFITEKIASGTLGAVGASVAVFWFTRALLQVPIASYLDRADGEQRDFHALVLGLVISAISAFLTPLASSMSHIYLLQFLNGIGYALYVPSWSAVFTHHVDPEHTALEWAIDRSVGGIATGVSGLLGGVAAATYGFPAVFVATGVLCMIGMVAIMFGPTFMMPTGLRRVRRPWDTFLAYYSNRTR